MTQQLGIMILAAGKGSRMVSGKPKVLHEVGGLPLLGHVIKTAESLNPQKIVCVIGQDMDEVAQAAKPYPCVVQKEQLGTGHAVQTAIAEFDGFEGTLIVMYGDTPLIQTSTFEKLLERHRSKDTPACTVMAMTPPDPTGYGRVVVDDKGVMLNIIEHKDCTPEQLEIKTCNSGILCFDAKGLKHWLPQLSDQNAQGEYYITDIPKIAAGSGRLSAAITTDYAECIGVNTRVQLAQVETIFQERKRQKFMEQGVTLLAPETVTFAYDTQIGKDVLIEPNVFFGTGAVVGDNVHIKGFCHIEGASIGNGSIIGPFARLRPGSELAEETKIGNFVELKKTKLGKGSKVNHLSYVGDAIVGEGANIGAGTITCNYDGFDKHLTKIGDDVFVGSNSTLIAPITLEKGAYIAAGSTIDEDVDEGTLAVARSRSILRPGWANNFRDKKKERKA